MDHDKDRFNKPTESPNSWDIFNGIFNRSNIIWLLWLLAIFLVAYFCVGLFSSDSELKPLRVSRLLDIMIFGIIFIYIIAISLNPPSDGSQSTPAYYSSFLNFMNDSYSIFGVILFILALYLAIYILNIPMTPDIKPYSVAFIENIAWFIFLILLICDFFKLILNIHIVKLLPANLPDSLVNSTSFIFSSTTINNINNSVNKVDSSNNKVDSSKNKVDSSNNKVDSSNNKIDSSNNKQISKPNEVFNISNNLYTYDQAKDICSAFDSKLATYDQIESAYNDGAEWCAYGWSDNQMAFFPTQKSSWDKLQKSDKTKNACGRPGINGGYMANPNIKFGVNCYGKKPNPSKFELDMMQKNTPTTIVDSTLDSKVKFWKDNRDRLLVLNSFNHNKWSEY